MPSIIYDGSAKDHAVTPQILHTDETNGRPMKRKVRVPDVTTFTPVDVYKLYGPDREYECPTGEKVSVPELWNKKPHPVLAKARTLPCFDVVENDAVAVKLEVKGDPVDVKPEVKGEHVEPPKKRGRPPKAKVAEL